MKREIHGSTNVTSHFNAQAWVLETDTLLAQRVPSDMSTRLTLEAQLQRDNTFQSSRRVSKNLELFNVVRYQFGGKSRCKWQCEIDPCIHFQSVLSETPFYSPYVTLAETTTTTESNDSRINIPRILKAIRFYSVGDHLICILAVMICATLRDQMVIKSRGRHLKWGRLKGKPPLCFHDFRHIQEGNLLQGLAKSVHKRIRSGSNHKLQRPRNSLNQRSLRGSLTTFVEKQCFIPSFTTTFGVNIRCKFGKATSTLHFYIAFLIKDSRRKAIWQPTVG